MALVRSLSPEQLRHPNPGVLYSSTLQLVGKAVGASEGISVGVGVGAEVGSGVGAALGEAVGAGVGETVGAGEGAAVGASVFDGPHS